MKTPLKVGDRVRVYGKPGPDGGCWEAKVVACRVVAPWGVGMDVRSTYDDETYTVHPKQCRRLIKKPRRRVWLNENALRTDRNNEGGWSVCFEKPKVYLSDWVEFIEARKPKGEK